MELYNNILDEIISTLPQEEKIKVRTEADCYGFSHYIASKLGIKDTPLSTSDCNHGWIHRDIKSIEEVISKHTLSHKRNYYSENIKMQRVLYSLGYYNSMCIGVPYIYIDDNDIEIKRYENTLLVMPMHTLEWDKNFQKINEEEYVKSIDSVRDDFDLIVFCISKSCITHNLWTKTIEKYNFPWIEGADVFDKNALARMNRIFRSFEYVSSHSIGSHIAYASYSGCKTTIYGKYIEPDYEQMERTNYMKENPHIIDNCYYGRLSSTVRKKYPIFFKEHPKDGVLNIDFAKKELGFECKVSYSKVAELLGWNNINCYENKIVFSQEFNKFYLKLSKLKNDNKRYLIYGYGTVGKVVYSFLSSQIVGIVDKNNIGISKDTTQEKIYSPKDIKKFNYDAIIICVIGREEEIIKSLDGIDNDRFIQIF
ncbi:hypothetical protein M947_08570 [Sulfurimonas hongkongensis]|uniref:Uncharacterized protein n=1 Tax=Sulfurimonas hongkongensis TaxID=1172190 RepID=T0JQU8_9BACT|nr:hypothetical protein [Sulfurimonas hongkongensis]EQB39197.1 hypothetical protein M947_08570 [Sulfurimonas hongkongensis]